MPINFYKRRASACLFSAGASWLAICPALAQNQAPPRECSGATYQSQPEQRAAPCENLSNGLRAAERSLAEKYLGNIDSMKYHKTFCEYAKMINPCRRILFDSRAKAIEAGMNPCNWCMPGWVLTVQGKLLSGPAQPQDRHSTPNYPSAVGSTAPGKEIPRN